MARFLINALALCLLAVPPVAAQSTFAVGTEAALRAALDPATGAQNGDTILFTADITLTGDLPVVQNSVTIDGDDHQLSGAGAYRGVYVHSGTVAILDLTILDALARGGGMGGDGGDESGTAGMAVDTRSEQSLQPAVGIRVLHTRATEGRRFEPALYVAYAYEVMDNVSSVNGRFTAASAGSLDVSGVTTDRGRMRTGVAINAAWTDRALPTIAWDAEFATSDTASALSATFRYRW